ncbi:MAG: O-antigen polysaccharide polymerase Wzy [Pseudomonadota bacterium]
MFGVGLPLAYVFLTAFEYVGAFIYLVPGYSHLRIDGSLYLLSREYTVETVAAGITLTVLGLAAFVAGVCLARPRRRAVAALDLSSALCTGARSRCWRLNMNELHLIGAFAFVMAFIVPRLQLPIPMLNVINLAAANAAVVYICLGFHQSLTFTRTTLPYWCTLIVLLVLYYLIVNGFASFGFAAIMIIAAFALVRILPGKSGPIRILGVGFLALYSLLTLFTAWMSGRIAFRSVIWSDASIASRIDALRNTLAEMRLLSPSDFATLDFLAGRLNQGMYVGKMIENHASYEQSFYWGRTLLLAAIAWIPRPLWPSKPTAGGSQLISEQTKLVFADDVTFGSGPIMEFYANFGTIGVLLGMASLGALIAVFDRKAGMAFSQGRTLTVILWFTAGVACIRPLSELFFIVNALVATILIFWTIRQILSLEHSRRPLTDSARHSSDASHRT